MVTSVPWHGSRRAGTSLPVESSIMGESGCLSRSVSGDIGPHAALPSFRHLFRDALDKPLRTNRELPDATAARKLGGDGHVGEAGMIGAMGRVNDLPLRSRLDMLTILIGKDMLHAAEPTAPRN